MSVDEARLDEATLPPGVLCVRVGPGANCSSAGSAIDVLFYGSAVIGALVVALCAALPPREPEPETSRGDHGRDDDIDGSA